MLSMVGVMKNTKKIFALGALVSLAVAGCSSSSSNSNATATPALTGTVRIGVEAPITGDQAETGKGMINGAQLAADQLNAKGGINGKKVVIVPIDDAADAVVGVKAATAALKTGLDGVVGPYNSGAGAKTLPLYIDKDLVPIRLTSNSVTTGGLGYTLQPMDTQIVPAATEALTKWKKAKTAVIVYDSTQLYTNSIDQSLSKSFQAAGVKLLANTAIQSVQSYYKANESAAAKATADKAAAAAYASAVKAAAALKPDVIYVATYSPEGGLIAKAVHDQKVTAACIADFGADDPGFITSAGSTEAAQGCSVIGVPSPGEFLKGPAFVSQYKAAFGAEPGTWSPYVYDSLNLLADAANKTGGFDKDKLTKELDATKAWPGVTGAVTLEPKTGNRVPATLVVLDVTKDGEFAIDRSWVTGVGAAY